MLTHGCMRLRFLHEGCLTAACGRCADNAASGRPSAQRRLQMAAVRTKDGSLLQVYDVTSLVDQKKCMLSLEAAQWWHQPHSEAGAQAALAGNQEGSSASPAASEAVARGVAGALWEIMRLRRTLAVIVLTWAATLHDPSTHVRDEGYARSIR